MEHSIRTLRLVLTALGVVWCGSTPAGANPRSVNVVMIGGSSLSTTIPCANSGGPANVAGWTAGGCLPVNGTPNEFAPLGDLSLFNFSTLPPANVTEANLASYDTAVLMMASSALRCRSDSLTAQAKTDLVNFVGSGKKLIIYDSECNPGPNYDWLPFPYQTNNPGATGSFGGTLTIVEQNTLSKSDPASPYYINTSNLTATSDAVADMNVMTTFDPNWSLDMSGTNVNHVTGPVHTYAKYPAGTDKGLIIYNGTDLDYESIGTPNFYLRKIWFLELLQPFNPSNLSGTVPVVGILVTPATAYNPPGRAHTVTATVTDLLNQPRANVLVTFTVTSGPDAGIAGTCSPADCRTDAAGKVSFTFTGFSEGTDQIKGCFTNPGGPAVCSAEATKIYTTKCDVDNNLAINILDIAAIFSARNTPAAGPSDRRDADGDGKITILDSRVCTLRCDKPNCAQ